MDLTCFLKQNAVPMEKVEYVVSERFLDKDKKPIKWIIAPINARYDEELKRQSMGPVDIDLNKYAVLLAAACTVYPDLNDAKLQDSYNAMNSTELLLSMLLPGELVSYVNKIKGLCGYDKTSEDLKKEAKN